MGSGAWARERGYLKTMKENLIILIYFYSEYLIAFWKLNYIKQGHETIYTYQRKTRIFKEGKDYFKKKRYPLYEEKYWKP